MSGMNLAQAVRLMQDENGVNDERFSEAWDKVTEFAAAHIVAKNAKEHLIWRDPFGDVKKFPHP